MKEIIMEIVAGILTDKRDGNWSSKSLAGTVTWHDNGHPIQNSIVTCGVFSIDTLDSIETCQNGAELQFDGILSGYCTLHQLFGPINESSGRSIEIKSGKFYFDGNQESAKEENVTAIQADMEIFYPNGIIEIKGLTAVKKNKKGSPRKPTNLRIED